MSDLEKAIGAAGEKAEDILGDFLEAAIIIGTYRDADGHTRKFVHPWGNELLVLKLIEVQHQEMKDMEEMCYEVCSHEDED